MWCCASAFPSSPWYPPQPNQLASGKPQRKEHCGGIEPHLHKPHFPDMLLTMLLPVVTCNLAQDSARKGFDVSCSTSLPKSPDRIAGIKKPRTMARLGVLIGQTQIRQPTLNILLICSLKCKHVMTIFCNFPHAFAIVKRILQRLVQAEERRVDNLLNFPADG